MDLRNNSIICLGSPMIDITARIPYDFLQKYKLKPNNATTYNDSYSQIFTDLQNYNPTYQVGGSITHAVKAIQKYLKIPGVCCYVGAIGKDDFGKEIEKQLNNDKINVFFEKINGETTSKCAVLLFEDNRSFVTDLGASKYLSEDFIDGDEVMDVIKMGKYYYLSAFFFKVSYSIVYKICTHAKANNKIFILNIGAPFLCHDYVTEFKEILPQTNILIGNIEESTHLAQVLGCEMNDINSIAIYLHNYCSQQQKHDCYVIITGGNDPVILASNDGIKKFEVPRLRNEKNLNTSGAGDYFAGGLIASFMLNKSIDDCIRSGISSSCILIEENS